MCQLESRIVAKIDLEISPIRFDLERRLIKAKVQTFCLASSEIPER